MENGCIVEQGTLNEIKHRSPALYDAWNKSGGKSHQLSPAPSPTPSHRVPAPTPYVADDVGTLPLRGATSTVSLHHLDLPESGVVNVEPAIGHGK